MEKYPEWVLTFTQLLCAAAHGLAAEREPEEDLACVMGLVAHSGEVWRGGEVER